MPKMYLVLTPEKITKRRKELDKSQGQMARKIKVRSETYSRWECGRLRPSKAHLIMLAIVLKFYNPESDVELVVQWQTDMDRMDDPLVAQGTDPEGNGGPVNTGQAGLPGSNEACRTAASLPALTGQPVVYLLNGEVLNQTVHELVKEKLDYLLAERETKGE